MYALEHRRELSGRWSWMLIAGLMDLLIAAIIIHGTAGIGPVGDRPPWSASTCYSGARPLIGVGARGT